MSVVDDLRLAARVLARRPVFSGTVILTLALGIGANAAVFGLTDAVLLRAPADVGDPDRVVAVYLANRDDAFGSVSYPDFRDLQARGDAFERLAVRLDAWVSFGAGDVPERVRAEVVSPGYFAVMGRAPFLGRAFGEQEARPDAVGVVVISHGLWSRSFAGDPNVLGRAVQLNGLTYTVVGVAAAGFRAGRLDAAADLWLPVGRIADAVPTFGAGALTNRHLSVFRVMGRLASGIDIERAQAAANAAAAGMDEIDPSRGGDPRRFTVLPAHAASFAPQDRSAVARFATMLSAVVALVLLIACLNIANLLLARGTERSREIAVRRALGAERPRLVRQLLTENFTLAAAGGVMATLLFLAIAPLLASLELPGALRVRPPFDARVLLFIVFATSITGLLFGILPALRATETDLARSLRQQAAAVGRARSRPLRELLVVGQVAVSTVLLIGLVLLLRTLVSLHAIEPGFATERILTTRIDVGTLGYERERGWQFFDELLHRVRALPGVDAASLTSELPLDAEGSRMALFVEGQGGEMHTDVSQTIVDVGIFRTMGLSLVRGRSFGAQDAAPAQRNVVVNRALAERFWPGQDPIGKRLGVGGPGGPFYRVIGVVENHRQADLRRPPTPHVFWAFRQIYAMMSGSGKTLVVRTANDAALLVPALRRVVGELEPNLPLSQITTMADHLRDHIRKEIQTAVLLGAFAILALLLAVSGVYGVVAFTVRQQTREIGLRIALGSAPRAVVRRIVERGAAVAGAGVLLGISGAAAVWRLLDSLLYGVRSTDATSLVGVSVAMLGVTVLATWLPARAASRVDPADALRSE